MPASQLKSQPNWKVLSHDPIDRLAENLWRVSGAIPRMSLRRTMTIARRTDGRLVIHGAIALNETHMTELESFGAPSFLVVPNAIHRMDAPAYKNRYPNLVVLTPRGARARVEKVVAVDGAFEDFPPDDAVWLEPLAGVGDVEGVMRIKSADGVSIVLGDIVFNMDRKSDVMGLLITTLFGSAPGPRVSRLAKATLVKDKAALRADLDRLAATPGLVRLVVAHEKVAVGAAAADALRRAATYL